MGKTDYDLAWKKEEADAFVRYDKMVMDRKSPEYHILEPQMQADGKQAWLDTNKIPLLNNNEEVIGIIGTFEDITDRIIAEKELKSLKRYLEEIINSMPSVLIGVDRFGLVTQWNTEAFLKTGISIEDSVGENLLDICPEMKDIMRPLKESIEKRKSVSFNREKKIIEGEPLSEYVTIYPLTSEGVDGAVVRIDDISEQYKLQDIMIQNEKMLSVGGLAAGMAHEINNPLAGMMQAANVMSNRLIKSLYSDINKKIAEEMNLDLETLNTFLEKRGILRMIEMIHESG